MANILARDKVSFNKELRVQNPSRIHNLWFYKWASCLNGSNGFTKASQVATDSLCERLLNEREPTATLNSSIKSLKEGQNRGFGPFLRKFSIKSRLARRVLEPILKVGWNYLNFLFLLERFWENKIGCVHGICYPKSWISLCKASLVHPS